MMDFTPAVWEERTLCAPVERFVLYYVSGWLALSVLVVAEHVPSDIPIQPSCVRYIVIVPEADVQHGGSMFELVQ